MTKDCPCGSGSGYADCCGPLLARARRAQTAEALMRSRYTAYVQSDAAYLEETLMPRKRSSFDADALLTWNADVTWKGLRILATDRGGPGEDDGVVEFIATYAKDGDESEVRETSRFRKKGGSWFYVDGRLDGEPVPESAAAPKAGRNEPCPCGSGKKFKRCCG